jgi:hypothetical protein
VEMKLHGPPVRRVPGRGLMKGPPRARGRRPGQAGQRADEAASVYSARMVEPVDRAFVTRNAEQRAQLERLVQGLTEADGARTIEPGWTVAATLAHIAFWERLNLAAGRRGSAQGHGPMLSRPTK